MPGNVLSYEYWPLLESREIRLVQIKVTNSYRYHPIKCTFRHVRLDETTPDETGTPPYKAISYRWGPRYPRRSVSVVETIPTPARPPSMRPKQQRMLLDVNQSLTELVSWLGRTQSSCWFWIDALCTYSERSSIKNLRNLRFLIQRFRGLNRDLNRDLLRSTDNTFSGDIIN